MFTPEYLGGFPDYIVGLFEEYDSFVIADFARRIGRAGRITDTARWQAERAREVGLAMDTLASETKKLLKISDRELQRMFREAGLEYVRSDQERMQVKIRQGEELDRYIRAAYRHTYGELRNMTRTTATGLKIGTKTIPIKDAYYQALDLAQMQVSTGVLDYETACRQAIRRISQMGLSTLTNDAVSYDSGYAWSIRAAVRACVLTGMNQMARQLNDMIADDLGLDLVEVTAHAGARPSHAVWQGGIYSRSGKSRKYPSLEETTGLGTVTGLMGVNCRHNYYAYMDGSPRAYTDKYLRELRKDDARRQEYNGKSYNAYEASQQQRALERKIIATKRQLIGYDAAGDKEAYSAAAVKLRQQRKEYEAYSDAMGLRRKWERAQQDGYDRRLSGKSTYAVRKYIANREMVREQARRDIRSGKYSTIINAEKQAKHMPGSGYVSGRSCITVPMDELQKLVTKQAGRGNPQLNRHGSWNSQETVDLGKIIGYTVNRDGSMKKTSRVKIHYSRTGIHVVPFSGKEQV